MKEVVIVKSSRPSYWYSKMVGQIVEVEDVSSNDYIVIAYGSKWIHYLISKCDTVEVKKEEPKKVTCKIDLSWLKGQAREVISEAIQKKLFEAGCKWTIDGDAPLNRIPNILCINSVLTYSSSHNEGTWAFDKITTLPEVSVNNALKGNFWTYSTKKEEPKPKGYKVSLAAYTGKAREAVSKAIQEEAFKKGYGWGWVNKDATIQNTGTMLLYFSVEDKAIMQDSTEDKKFFDSFIFKELSVEDILSGALPKVN